MMIKSEHYKSKKSIFTEKGALVIELAFLSACVVALVLIYIKLIR